MTILTTRTRLTTGTIRATLAIRTPTTTITIRTIIAMRAPPKPRTRIAMRATMAMIKNEQ